MPHAERDGVGDGADQEVAGDLLRPIASAEVGMHGIHVHRRRVAGDGELVAIAHGRTPYARRAPSAMKSPPVARCIRRPAPPGASTRCSRAAIRLLASATTRLTI